MRCRQFYHHSAYLRDPEQVDIMISYLKGLSRAKINAPVNSSFLNSWTPTPLILAGLIRGEASK
uniref:RUN domain-containing protein n=1 Tax=Plectus sambesii TaxID=2011161 RepID=A0A914VHQ5_9BILA